MICVALEKVESSEAGSRRASSGGKSCHRYMQKHSCILPEANKSANVVIAQGLAPMRRSGVPRTVR